MTLSDDLPDAELGARSSLSDRIYTELRVALMSGYYEPGDRLNIRRISQLSQTSPTPVREAVMQLVREGALELKTGYQPRVPVLSPEAYMRILEVRVPLERMATVLATMQVTTAMLEELRALDRQFIAAERGNEWKAAMNHNRAFHFCIYRASGNEVLVRTIENLWLLTGPLVGRQYVETIHRASDAALHGQIVEALERRAPHEASDLVVHDLRYGARIILERMRAAGTRRKPRAAEAAPD